MKEFNKELIQKQIGYDFGNDDDLLIQAFTHKTYAKEKGWESNQVLEFYGDEVLDFCVAKVLSEYYGYLRSEGDEDFDPREDYDEYITVDDMTEADLTEIKKKLVDNKMLAHRIELMGLQDYLYLGKGAEKQNVQNEEKTKADLFEAILGAIAFHSNWDMEKLEESVREMLNLDYYLSHGFDEDNDFTQLVQEWWQKRIGSIPDYDYRSSYVLDGGGTINHVASIRLTVDGYPYYFQGEGYTKADARYECAKKIYEFLDNRNLLISIHDDCPSEEELTDDMAINVLQELAQKGWISMPEYFFETEPVYDDDGCAWWECTCVVNSDNIKNTAHATSKKEAKKYAAYLCICEIMGYKDRYNQ